VQHTPSPRHKQEASGTARCQFGGPSEYGTVERRPRVSFTAVDRSLASATCAERDSANRHSGPTLRLCQTRIRNRSETDAVAVDAGLTEDQTHLCISYFDRSLTRVVLRSRIYLLS
jgi:hypothetical protein